MAEWLRPRVSIAKIELNIRRISVGSKSCPSKETIGWADGDKITSRRYYGRRKPNVSRAGWPSGEGPESSLPRTDIIYAG